MSLFILFLYPFLFVAFHFFVLFEFILVSSAPPPLFSLYCFLTFFNYIYFPLLSYCCFGIFPIFFTHFCILFVQWRHIFYFLTFLHGFYIRYFFLRTFLIIFLYSRLFLFFIIYVHFSGFIRLFTFYYQLLCYFSQFFRHFL